MDLISWRTMTELAKVLTFGAKKYAARNWEKGLSFSETFASLQRHAIKWYEGEDIDPETGLSHLAHVMCNTMFLLHFVLTGTGTDDRPKYNKETNGEDQITDADELGLIRPSTFPVPRGMASYAELSRPIAADWAAVDGPDYAVEHGRVPDLQKDLQSGYATKFLWGDGTEEQWYTSDGGVQRYDCASSRRLP